MDLNGVLRFVLFLVPLSPMICSFERKVCLETVLKFGLSDVACKFKKSYLEASFQELPFGRFPCKEQCALKVDLNDKKSVFKVKNVHILFNRDTLETHQCQSTHGVHGVNIKVHCSSKDLKNYFGHVCSNNSDILKLNTTYSKLGEMGTCACKDGFILVNGSCKKDIFNLTQLTYSYFPTFLQKMVWFLVKAVLSIDSALVQQIPEIVRRINVIASQGIIIKVHNVIQDMQNWVMLVLTMNNVLRRPITAAVKIQLRFVIAVQDSMWIKVLHIVKEISVEWKLQHPILRLLHLNQIQNINYLMLPKKHY
ncbi:uncharacterized protein LOC133188075 [Saccostrea echinata]|uniref:uncharacterized protein LOC133188075 n=1 Tax=Saccostrea echinata TaxID=191078 RepID=UPI002A82AC6D|nr:uncharacterized protein LOC133188075 [Saccostrea echinata]